MSQTVQNIATIKLNNHAGSLKPLSEDKENTLKHDLIQDYTALIRDAFFKDTFKSPLQSNLSKMHINISITKKNITVTNRDTNAKIQLPVIQDANTLKMNQIISQIFSKATAALHSSKSPSVDQSAPAAQTSPVSPTFNPSHRPAPLKLPSPTAAKQQDTVKIETPILASAIQKPAALSSFSPSTSVSIYEDPRSATANPLSPDSLIFESPKSTMPISPRSPDQEDLAPLSPMKPMGETQIRDIQTPASPRDNNLDLSPLPIHPLSPMKRSEGLEEPLSPLGMMISNAFKSAQQASATTSPKVKQPVSDAPKPASKTDANPKSDSTRTFKPTESVLKTHKQRRQPDSTFTKKLTPIFSLTPFIPKAAVKLTAPHPFSVSNSKDSMSPTPSSSRSRSDQELSPIVAEDFLREELELDDKVTLIHLAPGQPNLMISTPQTKNPKSNTTKTKTEKTWIKRIGSIFKSTNPTTSTAENHKSKAKTSFFKRLISKTSQKTLKKEPIPQPASDINEELDITHIAQEIP